MKTKLFILLAIIGGALAVFLMAGVSDKPVTYTGQKFNGLSFVAPPRPITAAEVDSMARVHANWITLMPYGFVREGGAEFQYRVEGDTTQGHQWWGESPEGIRTCIRLAKAKGIHVMLKPHMWYGRGNFTGDFTLSNEADWKRFEETFGAYILQYAHLAQEEGAEAVCIATEMHTMVAERPEFWLKLIKEIRTFYTGKLTYAENWDKYQDVPFWEQLDFIGVDAYFPLSTAQNPDVESLTKAWLPHIKELKKSSAKFHKPILFTEYGYRSCDFATDKPWETDYNKPYNEALQAAAYEALYQSVWQEPWMAGGFAWKWFPHKKSHERSRDAFCMQHKLAEHVMATQYAKNE